MGRSGNSSGPAACQAAAHRKPGIFSGSCARFARAVLATAFVLATDARPAAAQSSADLLADGFRLHKADQYAAARERFERALRQARAESDERAEASAHRGLGLLLIEDANYPAARVELERALSMFERLEDWRGAALAAENLAREADLVGDAAHTRALTSQALTAYEAHGDAEGQARVLTLQAFDSQLTPAASDALLERAETLARSIDHPSLVANILQNRADLAFTAGDYASAMARLEQAVAILETADEPNNAARALVSLGRVYRAHGQPERAIDFYRRALTIQEKVGDKQGAIQSINAIAVAEDLLQRHEAAVADYSRALAMARETGSPRIVAFQMGNLAGSYLKGGDPARAIPLLKEALGLPNDSFVASVRTSQLAEAYRGLGRTDEALAAASEALAMERAAGRLSGVAENLTLRSRIRRQGGDTAGALADVRESLQVFEGLRTRLVPRDVMKQGYSRLHQGSFALAIDLLTAARDDAGALATAEQARARAFLDLLASRDLRPPADRRGERDAVALESAGSVPSTTLEEMQATAARLQSTLLVYFVTPDATFAWVVKPDAVRSVRIDVSAQRLAELVRRTHPPERKPPTQAASTRQKLTTRGGDEFFFGAADMSAWRELYRLLIHPIRADLPSRTGSRLTIVPHGTLFELSFAALQDEAQKYLVEQYAIHYAPSAAVLRFTHERSIDAAGREPRFLLVADPPALPGVGGSRPLPALPGARREVASIAGLVPARATSVMAGDAAREADVQARMSDATVIHFATHAIVRDDDPLESYLALGGTPLTGADVYGLTLRADVVVLSACRTALGQISGDGIAGLTRAFFYAGAASVMATMWDVADEPTFRLVPEFYRLRIGGRDKAESLRSAQLRLLRDLRAQRVTITTAVGPVTLPEQPFFWAGFVLAGEP